VPSPSLSIWEDWAMPAPWQELERWLADARLGSQTALGDALETCRAYLLLIANQEIDPELRAKGSASDLVQETFLEAQRDFSRFGGQTPEELRAWLRQLLLHNLTDFTRRYRDTAKRSAGRELPLDGGSASGGPGLGLAGADPSPSAEAVAHEQAEALRQALQRLPEDYRQVILFRYQEQRSFEEIGQLLQRTPNAARLLWLRAVERLKQELGMSS
jgi:RNA polymerase sigma-70 factor (ECF subfamily)